ncbi:solute carrier family 2, facilitated glucose transporter member 1-like [Artemia franciscana]|uniref:solute carrier family 2, facilitated glucose transporter member 1-like n=1 Tax=Artemia franciscana TaxID=6661 RepID=UPI0032DB4F14
MSNEDKSSGLNGRLVFAIAAAAVGSGFQHGYNIGVVNAPGKLIQEWINYTDYTRSNYTVVPTEATITWIWSVAVSVYCIGGMIGGSLTGFFAEKFGRRGGLMVNNIFALIGAILEGFSYSAESYEMLIAGRVFIGINCGLNAGLAPMYLSEISPVNLRGAVGTMYQLILTISILISQILGMENIMGTETLWPYLLAFTAVAVLYQVPALMFCPESPKYILITKGREREAERALNWLRGTTKVEEEMEEMRAESAKQKLTTVVSLKEMLTNPCLKSPLIIAVMMQLAQQFSGINAVMFFSTSIFEDSGLNTLTSQYATLGMGVMNVLMTFVSLVLVEKAGRKTLQLVGLAGMFVVVILLTVFLAIKDLAPWIPYISIVLIIAFVVAFATGPGSIPWFLVSELFNQSARPLASSIAVTVNWTANFFVGIGFLPLAQLLGPYVFVIFAAILAFFVWFTWKHVPETKNKTIEEISTMFRRSSDDLGVSEEAGTFSKRQKKDTALAFLTSDPAVLISFSRTFSQRC